METILAYKNKESLIKRIKTHVELDELVQGATGNNGKGCTVWCALNNGDLKRGYDHNAFPDELGLPIWFAKLIDRIFEGLSVSDSKKFTLAWPEAIPEGANIERVKYQFLKWVLKDGEKSTYQYCSEKGKGATDRVYALLVRAEAGDMPSIDEWQKARNAATATAAAAAAYAAAAYAAAAAAAAATDADADAAATTAAAYAAARKNYYLSASKELIRLLKLA